MTEVNSSVKAVNLKWSACSTESCNLYCQLSGRDDKARTVEAILVTSAGHWDGLPSWVSLSKPLSSSALAIQRHWFLPPKTWSSKRKPGVQSNTKTTDSVVNSCPPRGWPHSYCPLPYAANPFYRFMVACHSQKSRLLSLEAVTLKHYGQSNRTQNLHRIWRVLDNQMLLALQEDWIWT